MMRLRIGGLLVLAFITLLGFDNHQLAYSAADSKSQDLRVPRIKQVAVMPVYWQTRPNSDTLQSIKDYLDKSFSNIARSSRRFYFPNDEITAELWADADGRRELAETYEIDAFLNLTVKVDGDLMIWTVRFMSPDLQNYLVESERIPITWAATASPEEREGKLKRLVFRILNRYPVDVFVTSIQGNFITLSGGSEQLIFEGDELDFFHTLIKARHPVDGSWIAFERKHLGKAKVISTHSQSAIAKLSSLAFEDAIKIGDGAIVPASATRRAFDKPKEEEPSYKPIANSPLVTVDGGPEPTMPLPPPPKEIPQREPALGQKKKPTETKPSSPVPNPETLREDREPPENDPPAEESENQTSVEEQPIPDNSAQKYSSLQIIASSDSFAYSGAASSQSKTSSLFLNNFLLRSSLNIDPDIDIHAELGFGFGSTTKGDFSGFSLRAEPLYHLKSFDGSVPGIDKFLAGASVRYETLGVTKQTFGGWDLFTVSPSFHAQSAIYFREENQIVDLDFSLKFALLTSGNAGIRGKTRDFEGLSQTEWELLGTLRPNPQEIEWGGFLANRSGSGKVGSRTLNFERLSLGVSARLAL